MLPEKEKCCGCGVCANICNLNACKMVSDNEGFLYPEIIADKCVHCKKCESSCPILNGKKHFTRQNIAKVLTADIIPMKLR